MKIDNIKQYYLSLPKEKQEQLKSIVEITIKKNLSDDKIGLNGELSSYLPYHYLANRFPKPLLDDANFDCEDEVNGSVISIDMVNATNYNNDNFQNKLRKLKKRNSVVIMAHDTTFEASFDCLSSWDDFYQSLCKEKRQNQSKAVSLKIAVYIGNSYKDKCFLILEDESLIKELLTKGEVEIDKDQLGYHVFSIDSVTNRFQKISIENKLKFSFDKFKPLNQDNITINEETKPSLEKDNVNKLFISVFRCLEEYLKQNNLLFGKPETTQEQKEEPQTQQKEMTNEDFNKWLCKNYKDKKISQSVLVKDLQEYQKNNSLSKWNRESIRNKYRELQKMSLIEDQKISPLLKEFHKK